MSAMSMQQAQNAISDISIGSTRIVNGRVVTHLGRDVYDVSTRVHGTVTGYQAAYLVCGAER